MADPSGGAVKVPGLADVSRFPSVDQEPDPAAFVTFLDAVNGLPDIQAIKERVIARLDLQAGQRVLDVGCGTGDDTRRLAGLVAPSGQAVGVDGWSLGHISNVTGISRPRLHRMLMNKET